MDKSTLIDSYQPLIVEEEDVRDDNSLETIGQDDQVLTARNFDLLGSIPSTPRLPASSTLDDGQSQLLVDDKPLHSSSILVPMTP